MTAFHHSAEWSKAVRQLRPIYAASIKAGTAVCARCGQRILPGQPFDVGHRLSVDAGIQAGLTFYQLSRPELLQIEHRACNRRDGQRTTTAKRTATRQETSRLPNW